MGKYSVAFGFTETIARTLSLGDGVIVSAESETEVTISN